MLCNIQTFTRLSLPTWLPFGIRVCALDLYVSLLACWLVSWVGFSLVFDRNYNSKTCKVSAQVVSRTCQYAALLPSTTAATSSTLVLLSYLLLFSLFLLLIQMLVKFLWLSSVDFSVSLSEHHRLLSHTRNSTPLPSTLLYFTSIYVWLCGWKLSPATFNVLAIAWVTLHASILHCLTLHVRCSITFFLLLFLPLSPVRVRWVFQAAWCGLMPSLQCILVFVWCWIMGLRHFCCCHVRLSNKCWWLFFILFVFSALLKNYDIDLNFVEFRVPMKEVHCCFTCCEQFDKAVVLNSVEEFSKRSLWHLEFAMNANLLCWKWKARRNTYLFEKAAGSCFNFIYLWQTGGRALWLSGSGAYYHSVEPGFDLSAKHLAKVWAIKYYYYN